MMQPTQKVRILVADADERVVSLLRGSLESAGFDVDSALNANEAISRVGQVNPALLIFDTMLPGMAGTDFLRTLRSTPATCNIPIIALSERAGEIDRIVGLELGADDYVSKPFSARELTLRVKAILSRCPAAPDKPDRFRAGRLMLDVPRHEVSIDGVAVALSALEFRLLATLLREEGRVVSRDQLIEKAWGPDSEVSQRTVDTQLRRLRVKLGPAAEQIQTVRGFGYRLGE
jgi:two-component system phosphate regulon response regulator PhoB